MTSGDDRFKKFVPGKIRFVVISKSMSLHGTPSSRMMYLAKALLFCEKRHIMSLERFYRIVKDSFPHLSEYSFTWSVLCFWLTFFLSIQEYMYI